MPPLKYSPELLAQILSDLRLGIPPESAAKRAGISPRTLRQWMNDDEDILISIEKAKVELEFRAIGVLNQGIDSDNLKLAVETAKWVAERVNPAAWGSASRNDAFTREQRIRATFEQLLAEGLPVTLDEVAKEFADFDQTKALPSGKK